MSYSVLTRKTVILFLALLSGLYSFSTPGRTIKKAVTDTLPTQVMVTSRPSPNDGYGGPILCVYKSSNPFSRYTTEILRAQGFNEFDVKEISEVTPALLTNYDVVVLGEMSLAPSDITNFSDWTTAGGIFISFRPDALLSPLLGITTTGNTLANSYLLVSNTDAGAGIVHETIQYHGEADKYTLNTATALAILYTDATTATSFPAVTVNNVGSNGGKAIAFTYDLAKSIIQTRQGNPAWAGQDRDGTAPIRSDDLFFGNAAGDLQPDWVDLNKVSIPQADEQMHLLTNIIALNNLNHKPLPRFWFLPDAHKAAVVMTGDDHGSGGTIGRFNQYLTLSGSYNNPADVADWKAIRGTSYIYPNTPITPAEVTAFEAQGFEIGLHLTTYCSDFTPASLEDNFTTQLDEMAVNFPLLSPIVTNRTHCIAWSDWATMAKKEAEKGIFLDANYYYWPAEWVLDRPGVFTGSGMPMRFADNDGSLIDCYQVATQLTDESAITYNMHINALLNKATGPEGYYGVFCANMHTDVNGGNSTAGSDAIIAAAQTKNIPVISAKQLLTWLDGRNSSSFSNMVWNSNTLTFTITTDAHHIKAMLPRLAGTDLRLQSVSVNGNSLPLTFETIKGIEYGFFDAAQGDYTAVYEIFTCTAPTAVLAASPSALCLGEGPASLQLSSATGLAPYTIVVNGETYTNVNPGTPFLSFTPNKHTIWDNSTIGGEPTNVDNSSIELGVKFRTTTSGYVTGIRFYKRLANTGAHTGSLWSASGSLLATVTFAGETATGWQEAKFSSPVFVEANTTYTASYYAPNGQYAFTEYGFQSAGAGDGTITALQSGTDGLNGVFKYGTGGVIPDESFHDANYWVDVLFFSNVTTPQANNYIISSITDANGCSNNGPSISTAVVTVNPLPAGTVTLPTSPICENSNINLVLNATTGVGPFQVTVNGNTYTNVQSGVAFSTGITAATPPVSIWDNSATPAVAAINDGSAIEIGVKFRSSVNGLITGIRFYKGAANASTGHVGNLYNSSGTLLASVAFTNTNNATEGWVEASFSSPVHIDANTTYIASYYSPYPGWFAFNNGQFNGGPVTNAPLTALQNGTDGPNGVYKYNGGFPDAGSGANYWVDVIFKPEALTLSLTSITDVNGCNKTTTTNIAVNISAACGSLPVTLLGLKAVGTGTKALLTWATSSENNNRGFEIERSTNGSNWTSVGFVASQGNSSLLTNYSFTDPGLSHTHYYYRLKQIDLDNHFKYSNIAVVDLSKTDAYLLLQNFPNPFEENTTISYYIPKTAKIRLTLLDANGREIKVLANQVQAAGSYSIPFYKKGLSSGIYYYRLQADDFSSTRKLIIQ